MVKNLPATQEMQFREDLGQKDHFEEEMTTHSSTLGRIMPWTEEPGGLQSVGSHERSDATEATEHARAQSGGEPF